MAATVEGLPTAPYIRLDLFPAHVTTPTEILDRVRVLITEAHLLVIRLTPTGEPVLAMDPIELYSVEKDLTIGPRGHRVRTEDGAEILIKKSLNCGCGMTRLKVARVYDPPLPVAAL